MAFHFSGGSLARLGAGRHVIDTTDFGVRGHDGELMKLSALYERQSAVRTVIGGIARHIAQLQLHLFRKKPDDDRERVTDHPILDLLNDPAPGLDSMDWVESMVNFWLLYGNGLAWLRRDAKGVPVRAIPVPIDEIVDKKRRGWMQLDWIDIAVDERYQVQRIDASDLIHLRMFSPRGHCWGLTPALSLTSVLQEADAATKARARWWNNGMRSDRVIERPSEAPRWSEEARKTFRATWQAAYSGVGNTGIVPILEDGMTLKTVNAEANAKGAQYIETRQLAREEVAAAYWIDPAMVAMVGASSAPNQIEARKRLYVDTLGPLLRKFERKLNAVLLPEWDDTDDLYLEFNVLEKIRGDFDTLANLSRTLVGRPTMTLNEWRARANLPRIDQPWADEVVVPLNVALGTVADPGDTAPPQPGAEFDGDGSTQPQKRLQRSGRKASGDVTLSLQAQGRVRYERVLKSTLNRQKAALLSSAGALDREPTGLNELWTPDQDRRWKRELSRDLYRANQATAVPIASVLSAQWGEEFDEDTIDGWLEANATRSAAGYLDSLNRSLAVSFVTDDAGPLEAIKTTFDTKIGTAGVWAVSHATEVGNWSRMEAAKSAGRPTKTWTSTTGNARHAFLDGETVELGGVFSNGWDQPGAIGMPPEEKSGCGCILTFGE